MIRNGVQALWPLPPTIMMDLTPRPNGPIPIMEDLINVLVNGPDRRRNSNCRDHCRQSPSCRSSHCERTVRNDEPFMDLLGHLLFDSVDETRRNCLRNILVNQTRDGHNSTCSEGKNTTTEIKTSQKSTSSESGTDKFTSEETHGAIGGDCKEESHPNKDSEVNSDKNSDTINIEKNLYEKKPGKDPWEYRVNLEGCDQVRAFTESGVLTVEGRQQTKESKKEIKHCITLPSTVDPETLTSTLTQKGQLIIRQRDDRTTSDVTKTINIVKESEDEKNSVQESSKDKTKEEEKGTHGEDEKHEEVEAEKQE